MHRRIVLAAALAVLACIHPAPANQPAITLKKVNDLVIYRDDKFYSSFPSVVRRPDGELIVAFRRAPNRRLFGEAANSHTDLNSQLVLVRSRDAGQTWTKSPELIYAHPFGGSQDPCLVQLRNGTIVCSSYGWTQVQPQVAASLTNSTILKGGFVFLGGYVLQSPDGGHSWRGPFYPPPVPGNQTLDVFGQPIPAFNRGAMCEGADGKLYWVVAASVGRIGRTETHLLTSSDQGRTWTYSCPVAADPRITFNESSLYETPKGDLVAFMRTANFNDHTVLARSTNQGKSFQPWQDTGFKGHPHHLIRLPDDRALLVYGYRHAPFGIRARVLDADCTHTAAAPEIILRDDGGNGDLGYPWATMISGRQILVVYYFNQADGPRYIAGTILEMSP
jgi:hypothetical protein